MSDQEFSAVINHVRSRLNLDRRSAILGDGNGNTWDTIDPASGRVWVRYQTSNGLSTPILVRGPYTSVTPLADGQPVWIGKDFDSQDYVISSDFSATVAGSGVPIGGAASAAITGNGYVIQDQIVTLRCSQSIPASLIVHLSGWKPIVSNVMYDFLGQDVDLSSLIPATDTHAAVGVFVKPDLQTTEIFASPSIPINDALSVDDVNAMLALASVGSTIAWVYDLRFDAKAVLDSDTLVDARQIINTAPPLSLDPLLEMI